MNSFNEIWKVITSVRCLSESVYPCVNNQFLLCLLLLALKVNALHCKPRRVQLLITLWSEMYFVFWLQLAPPSSQNSCEVMADSVQLGISPAIIEAVDKLTRVALPLVRRLIPPKRKLCGRDAAMPSFEQEGSSSLWSNASVRFQCTNFNMFLSCENSGKNWMLMLYCRLKQIVWKIGHLFVYWFFFVILS